MNTTHNEIIMFYAIWKERLNYPKQGLHFVWIGIGILVSGFLYLSALPSFLNIIGFGLSCILFSGCIYVSWKSWTIRYLGFFDAYEKLIDAIEIDMSGAHDKGYHDIFETYISFMGIKQGMDVYEIQECLWRFAHQGYDIKLFENRALLTSRIIYAINTMWEPTS